MAHANQIRNLEERKERLTRLISQTKEQKEKLIRFVNSLTNQYNKGMISYQYYANTLQKALNQKTAQQWIAYYNTSIRTFSTELTQCTEALENLKQEPQSFSRTFALFIAAVIALGLMVFIQPSITGFFAGPISTALAEDGYTVEGFHWMEIKGSRVYERCLQVTSETPFDAVSITGKITSATATQDLTYSIYTDNHDEPGTLAGSCTVQNYANIWKTCTISSTAVAGNYWICAANSEGDHTITYYTIGYQNGDNRKTALWTGSNWQKLNRASYTLKATFMTNAP